MGGLNTLKLPLIIEKTVLKILIYSTVYVIIVLYIGVIFMAVPDHIRKVPRPVNTIVEDNGRDGPNRYAVRERISTRYIPGGNPQPRNGKVIGHIRDGRFVSKQEPSAVTGPDMLSYGASAFVKSVSQDILDDLMDVYPIKEAYTIMAIATLRIIKPTIVNGRLSSEYSRTFVCRDYPGIGMSANTISAFLQRLGQDGKKRRLFYQKRAARVAADHHVAIDGMLKQDTSIVNDLSAFSYKARIKGCRDVSVIYAYDIEAMEPICAEVFPGNSIDAVSYRSFILDNDIKSGIIIADKGFPPVRIIQELGDRPDLHFLTPIKRNDSRIGNNDMLTFDGVLDGIGDHVLYKKSCIKGGRYLYSYKSARKAAIEEADYLARREKNKDFVSSKYEHKRNAFGVIVFESDLDMDPKTAYLCYDERWMLELVFRQYKNDQCLDKTNVQGDFSLMGSEFVNFIATVTTCRLIGKARDAGLLGKMSYKDLMDDLSSAWRMVDSPEPPRSDDGCWVHTITCVFEELEALGLSIPVPGPEPRKRGRPRKEPAEQMPKRPRGRPRKNS